MSHIRMIPSTGLNIYNGGSTISIATGQVVLANGQYTFNHSTGMYHNGSSILDARVKMIRPWPLNELIDYVNRCYSEDRYIYDLEERLAETMNAITDRHDLKPALLHPNKIIREAAIRRAGELQ